MADWFKISIPYRTVHLFFPRIILWILGILAVIMFIQYAVKCKKQNKPIFDKSKFLFFDKNTNHLMLWGSIVLLVCYIASLEPLGFVVSSLIFIFLYNILFARSICFSKSDCSAGPEDKPPFERWITRIGRVEINWKSLLIGAIISVIASYGIWFLFYEIFNITLP